MTDTATPPRRRAIVAATATLTALATVAAMGVLTAATSTPSAASTRETDQVVATTDPTVGLGSPAASATLAATATVGSAADIRNVVFILADDLDWELFKQVPRLAALQDKGMTFTNHTVTDSLCCPSRTSIMRSQYIHNHGVISNESSTGGGWPTFRDRGEHTDCLPVWLQSAGVTTALFGKYLNDYPEAPRSARYVPPGWTKWAVPTSRGDSYAGYYYTLNSDGVLHKYRSAPEDFLNDVITTKAVDFVRTAPEGFFLTLSTYNPHKPAPVAVRNKSSHLTTVAPRNPNYNTLGANAPTWIRNFGPVQPWKLEQLDRLWRRPDRRLAAGADDLFNGSQQPRRPP